MGLPDISPASPETRRRPVKEQDPVAGLVPKGKEAQETWFALREAQEALDAVDAWTAEALEAACRDLTGEHATGWKEYVQGHQGAL